MYETQREASALCASSASVVVQKVPKFLLATALQHCFKSSCHSAWVCGALGDRTLPLRVTVAVSRL